MLAERRARVCVSDFFRDMFNIIYCLQANFCNPPPLVVSFIGVNCSLLAILTEWVCDQFPLIMNRSNASCRERYTHARIDKPNNRWTIRRVAETVYLSKMNNKKQTIARSVGDKTSNAAECVETLRREDATLRRATDDRA